MPSTSSFSLPELILFLTSLVVGLTMVMGVNAINSAPNFMLDYYKYINHSETAVPRFEGFWKNVLTYYTVVTLVAQALHEPTNLTSFMSRFSLVFRMLGSVVLMLVELIVIVVLPHSGTSEEGAIAAMVIVAYLGGCARAYYENTGYALFGPCPSKMLSGMLVGSAASGALVSIIQIILKAAMEDTYDSVLTQSVIYFTLSMGIIFLGGLGVLLLVWNPSARRYISEFRSRRTVWQNVYCKVEKPTSPIKDAKELEDGDEPVMGEVPRGREEVVFDDRVVSSKELTSSWSEEKGEGEEGGVVDAPTTSELLQGVRVWAVVKEIWPVMLSCVLTFGITYLLYPGMLLAVDPEDGWYTTIVMTVYNFGDLIGRILSMIKKFWIPRRVVVISSLVRLIFIPLLMLCAAGKIPSHAAAYVFTALLSVSNGFFGTLSMVYAPSTATLTTEGERAMAGQATGVMLLAGCAVGSLVQIGLVIPFN